MNGNKLLQNLTGSNCTKYDVEIPGEGKIHILGMVMCHWGINFHDFGIRNARINFRNFGIKNDTDFDDLV